jgi:hypothetical protein
MTEKFDVNTWFKSYRDAFAPAQRAQAEGLKAFERVLRHQYAVAGDYLEFSLHAAKAAFAAKTGDDFAVAQRELGSDFSTKLRQRAEEFATIATETQNSLNGVFAEAADSVVASRKKAA